MARIHRDRRETAGNFPGRIIRPRAEGTILIVTLWIILALTALLLTLSRSMRIEAQCSANALSAAQAAAVEQGAMQYVLSRVDGLAGDIPDEANTPCQAVRVGNGAFWILRCDGDGTQYTYGITDEASKLNLNTASLYMLTLLPGMDTDLAPALVDWRSPAATNTPGGAESDYYLLLDDPYYCKNAPLETIEELMLVKDFTPDVVFGEDYNRNGYLDDNENDGSASEPNDNADGHLDRGPYAYGTVYSAEPRTSASGARQVDLNTASTTALETALSTVLSSSRAMEIAQATVSLRLNTSPGARQSGFLNLIDFYFRASSSPAARLTMDEFLQIADLVTVSTSTASAASRPSSSASSAAAATALVQGKINVNTAPAAVLSCLPGLTDSDVQTLIDYRANSGNDLTTIAWVADALKSQRAKAVGIGGLITTRAYQFSADIVAVSGDGRAFRRCRIVVDTAQSAVPRIVYRQDMTGLGWPLDQAILDRLRAGDGMDKVLQETGQLVQQLVQ
jgi:DNA uptake protein ComE-like DNA-binding protein